MAGPVGLADAQAFRRTAALLAGLSLAPAVLVGQLILEFDPTDQFLRKTLFGMTTPAPPLAAADLLLPLIAAYVSHAFFPLGAIVFLVLAAGSTETWFRRYRPANAIDDRGAALANYAAAPLAWLPAAVLLIAAAGLLVQLQIVDSSAVMVVAGCPAVLIVLLWWHNTWRLLGRCTTLAGPMHMVVGGILVPLGWIVAAFVGLVIVPWIGGFLSLVVSSLS